MPRSLYPNRSRCTKIVATVGPATASDARVRALLQAGVSCIRVNASHGHHAEHAEAIARVRREAERSRLPVGVLYDLQGPKIRVADFEGPPYEVRPGDEIVFAVGRAAGEGELGVDYGGLDDDVRVGDPLLIDDGHVSTQVISVEPGRVRCRVANEGVIHKRKGINLPLSPVSVPAMTAKDHADAIFAAGEDVDFIALSFVREAGDIARLREVLAAQGVEIPIIAKIEKRQAVENLDAILEEAWGVMVARGDLGVELPPEEVPLVQKDIITRARHHGKPVIIATQMLESMTHNPRPTRAEASDVANAVLDGTDAVMLSGETAVGRYPVQTVELMARIVLHTEQEKPPDPMLRRRERRLNDTSSAVVDAAVQVAYHLRPHAIVALTRTGRCALRAAQRRPDAPLFGLTPSEPVRRMLSLVWGVQPYRMAPCESTDALVDELDRQMIERGLARESDQLVLLMGAPSTRLPAANTMKVHYVGERHGGELAP